MASQSGGQNLPPPRGSPGKKTPWLIGVNVCTVPTSFLTNSSYLLGFVIYSCSLCAKIKTPTFGFLQEVKC